MEASTQKKSKASKQRRRSLADPGHAALAKQAGDGSRKKDASVFGQLATKITQGLESGTEDEKQARETRKRSGTTTSVISMGEQNGANGKDKFRKKRSGFELPQIARLENGNREEQGKEKKKPLSARNQSNDGIKRKDSKSGSLSARRLEASHSQPIQKSNNNVTEYIPDGIMPWPGGEGVENNNEMKKKKKKKREKRGLVPMPTGGGVSGAETEDGKGGSKVKKRSMFRFESFSGLKDHEVSGFCCNDVQMRIGICGNKEREKGEMKKREGRRGGRGVEDLFYSYRHCLST